MQSFRISYLPPHFMNEIRYLLYTIVCTIRQITVQRPHDFIDVSHQNISNVGYNARNLICATNWTIVLWLKPQVLRSTVALIFQIGVT